MVVAVVLFVAAALSFRLLHPENVLQKLRWYHWSLQVHAPQQRSCWDEGCDYFVHRRKNWLLKSQLAVGCGSKPEVPFWGKRGVLRKTNQGLPRFLFQSTTQSLIPNLSKVPKRLSSTSRHQFRLSSAPQLPCSPLLRLRLHGRPRPPPGHQLCPERRA